MKLSFCLCLLFAASSSFAAKWVNVDAENYLGGRKASAGYLMDKVVLVVRWTDDSDATKELLKRVEDLWDGFKGKRLVILGSCFMEEPKGEKARALVREAEVSFPVYASAGLATNAPSVKSAPLYAADETGRVVYLGRNDRNATQAIVGALTDLESPRSVKQWRRFLDYELEHLPAHAYNRLNAFRKLHPDEAKDYLGKAKALVAIPDVKKVADLVEFSRRAKDAPAFGSSEQDKRRKYEALVIDTLSSCAPLKEVEDPRLRQEAKNALADLAWTKASF